MALIGGGLGLGVTLGQVRAVGGVLWPSLVLALMLILLTSFPDT